MTRAFLFAISRMSWNRVMSRLRRLREPRYILSGVAAAAYFWFLFFRHTAQVKTIPHAYGQDITTITALVLLSVFIGAWGLPQQSGGLEFSEAEIHFLFAAPLSRWQLLFYKFLRSQWRVMFTVFMMWIFGVRRSGNVLGMYAAFAVMSIYFTMTALGRARLKLAGVGAIARMVIVALLLAALSILVTKSVSSSVTTLGPNAGGAAAVVHALERGLDRPVFHALLFVPRFFAGAIFERTTAGLAVSILGLAILATLFFFAAVRLNVSFEEASIEVSNERRKRRSRMTQRHFGTTVTLRTRIPFPLAPSGRPEYALLWKNLIATMRVSLTQVAILILPMITVAAVLLYGGPGSAEVSLLLTCMLALGFILFGPMAVRTDLRADIGKLDILKSYPIAGEWIVSAEMAAPLALISAAELVLLMTAWALAAHVDKFADFGRPEYAVIAIIFIVPITAIELLIQNAIVILFPAWTAVPSREAARGFLAMGQRVLLMVGQVITLCFAAIPAAIVGVPCLLLAQRFLSGGIALAVSAVPPAAVLVAEIWIAIRLLGAQFDAIDVTTDLEAAGA